VDEEMLVAALLFVAGLILGWRYSVFALVLSSGMIFFGSIILFLAIYRFCILELIMLFAFLLAHQAGYLFGSYLSYGRQNN
jgi:hypothetical protein